MRFESIVRQEGFADRPNRRLGASLCGTLSTLIGSFHLGLWTLALLQGESSPVSSTCPQFRASPGLACRGKIRSNLRLDPVERDKTAEMDYMEIRDERPAVRMREGDRIQTNDAADRWYGSWPGRCTVSKLLVLLSLFFTAGVLPAQDRTNVMRSPMAKGFTVNPANPATAAKDEEIGAPHLRPAHSRMEVAMAISFAIFGTGSPVQACPRFRC